MKPGSVKIIDRISAVEAIKRLNEEDLLFLNRLIVERLKLISQAKSTSLMASFTKGDWVGKLFDDRDRFGIPGHASTAVTAFACAHRCVYGRPCRLATTLLTAEVSLSRSSSLMTKGGIR